MINNTENLKSIIIKKGKGNINNCTKILNAMNYYFNSKALDYYNRNLWFSQQSSYNYDRSSPDTSNIVAKYDSVNINNSNIFMTTTYTKTNNYGSFMFSCLAGPLEGTDVMNHTSYLTNPFTLTNTGLNDSNSAINLYFGPNSSLASTNSLNSSTLVRQETDVFNNVVDVKSYDRMFINVDYTSNMIYRYNRTGNAPNVSVFTPFTQVPTPKQTYFCLCDDGYVIWLGISSNLNFTSITWIQLVKKYLMNWNGDKYRIGIGFLKLSNVNTPVSVTMSCSIKGNDWP